MKSGNGNKSFAEETKFWQQEREQNVATGTRTKGTER
jgi:hypothetical protein